MDDKDSVHKNNKDLYSDCGSLLLNLDVQTQKEVDIVAHPTSIFGSTSPNSRSHFHEI